MNRRSDFPVDIVRGRQDPHAVERLIRSLPDWFGAEESTLEYVENARRKPTYFAVVPDSPEIVGVLLTTVHNPVSVEIDLMAALEQASMLRWAFHQAAREQRLKPRTSPVAFPRAV